MPIFKSRLHQTGNHKGTFDLLIFFFFFLQFFRILRKGRFKSTDDQPGGSLCCSSVISPTHSGSRKGIRKGRGCGIGERRVAFPSPPLPRRVSGSGAGGQTHRKIRPKFNPSVQRSTCQESRRRTNGCVGTDLAKLASSDTRNAVQNLRQGAVASLRTYERLEGGGGRGGRDEDNVQVPVTQLYFCACGRFV